MDLCESPESYCRGFIDVSFQMTIGAELNKNPFVLTSQYIRSLGKGFGNQK